jgi:alpha-N-arabinofuranosidase
MLRTPTYWAMRMLKRHQGGQVAAMTGDGGECEIEGVRLPAVSASVTAIGEDWTLSFASLDLDADQEVVVEGPFSRARAEILKGSAMGAHNTFEQPDAVAAAEHPVECAGGRLRFRLPRHSVVAVSASGT